MKAKSLVLNFAKYAIGLGLLAFVLWRSWDDKIQNGKLIPGLSTTLQKPPDWSLVPVGGALITFVVVIQLYRWYLLVRAVDLPFTKWNALRLGLVGYFYNSFLPGAIGGDAVKMWYIAKDHPTRRPVAVATVAIDRLLGLFGLLLIGSVVGGAGWATGNAKILGDDYLKLIVAVTIFATACFCLAWFVLGWMSERRKNQLENRLHRLKPRKVGRALAEVWFAVRTYRNRSRVMLISLLISAAAHLCMVLLFYICVRIFPLDEPATLAETALIAPVGYIAQAFFFLSPGGVGGAEAIFGFLYSRFDLPESTGVIGRLTLRVFEWAMGLIGYLVFLNMKKELQIEPLEMAEPALTREPENRIAASP